VQGDCLSRHTCVRRNEQDDGDGLNDGAEVLDRVCAYVCGENQGLKVRPWASVARRTCVCRFLEDHNTVTRGTACGHEVMARLGMAAWPGLVGCTCTGEARRAKGKTLFPSCVGAHARMRKPTGVWGIARRCSTKRPKGMANRQSLPVTGSHGC
jgi:hypothetical protein